MFLLRVHKYQSIVMMKGRNWVRQEIIVSLRNYVDARFSLKCHFKRFDCNFPWFIQRQAAVNAIFWIDDDKSFPASSYRSFIMSFVHVNSHETISLTTFCIILFMSSFCIFLNPAGYVRDLFMKLVQWFILRYLR